MRERKEKRGSGRPPGFPRGGDRGTRKKRRFTEENKGFDLGPRGFSVGKDLPRAPGFPYSRAEEKRLGFKRRDETHLLV